jgi:hypothetical protein
MSENDVPKERTGWRDEELSRKHRNWGHNLPIVDIDFLVVLYDRAQPTALIEYKQMCAPAFSADHPSYRALAALADGSAIPFFVVHYNKRSWTFKVQGINGKARELHPQINTYDEPNYVGFLYHLQGRIKHSSDYITTPSEIKPMPFEDIPFDS